MKYLFCLLIAGTLNCQTPNWQFAWDVFSPKQYAALSYVETGPGSDLYLCGTFSDTLFLKSDTLVGDSKNLFILRCDQQGKILWTQTIAFKYPNQYSNYPIQIITDKEKNLYILAKYQGQIIFGQDTFAIDYPQYDSFISKINSAGNILWTRTLDNSLATAKCIAVDSQGNIVLAGGFNYSLTTLAGVFQSAGLSDLFIIKYNSNGTLVWVQTAGGSKDESANGIVVDSHDNIIINGNFESSFNWNGNLFLNSGAEDMFVVELSPQGQISWINTSGYTTSRDISCDGSQIWVAANYSLSNDILLTRYNSNGSSLFTRKISGNIWDLDLTSDSTGTLYVAGSFAGDSCIFESSPQPPIINTYYYGPYMQKPGMLFVGKLNAAGNFMWVKSAPMKKSYIMGQYVRDIAVDIEANVYVVGGNYCTSYFDNDSVVGDGNYPHSFLTKLKENYIETVTKDNAHHSRLHIFPNPASKTIFISCDNCIEITQIKLIDQLGRAQIVATHKLNEHIILPIDNQSAGLYLIEVSTGISRLLLKVMIER